MTFCTKQTIPLDPCFLTAGTALSVQLNSTPVPYQNSCCKVLTSDTEEKASESESPPAAARGAAVGFTSQAAQPVEPFYFSSSFLLCICFCSQTHSSVCVQMTDVFILHYRWNSV